MFVSQKSCIFAKNILMKIVVASDSFKGSLTSYQVAQAVEQAAVEFMPDSQVIVLPVADGGEGWVEAMAGAMDVERVATIVGNPISRPILATYARVDDTAIIEMAAASGLTLLQPSEYNPLLTSTYGTGELIVDALQRGCKRLIIGIGGSATNDAGVGMLQALGCRFYDAVGCEIPRCTGRHLEQIARVDASALSSQLEGVEIIVASDVQVPLCGPGGATNMFARQKGADDQMVNVLEAGMCAFAELVQNTMGVDVRELPGGGAAGGLGAALYAFCGATILPGIEVVLRVLDFDSVIQDADLIITGEGKLDAQTATGKVPAGILAHAQKQHIPVVAIAGRVEMCEQLEQMGFAGIYATTPPDQPTSLAMQDHVAIKNIKHTIARVLESFLMK